MPDRSIAPSFTRSTNFDLIQPKEFTLSNGLRTFIVAGGTQPVLRIELVLKAGRWFEKNSGASYFASNLLSKGTSTKSSFEIAQIFDQYGAHLEISPGLDVVSVSLYTLVKTLQPTLTLFCELLTDSVFSEKEFGQLKSIYLQNLKVNNEKTSFQASKLIRRNIFGNDHPYGKELEAEDVNALTREQLVDHYTALGKDITLFVSGQVDDATENFLKESFSSLPVSRSKDSVFGNVNVQASRQHVKKEDSVQSSIRMGKKIIGRTHADYPATLLLNHILGGYFGSRLMKNIREEKGLSYGIYSSLHTLLKDNYLVIGADVNSENLDLTFDEIRKELKRLRAEPIDAEELDVARNHFIGSLQSEMTTSFAHAEKIKNIFLFGLPANYYQHMINTIDHVTAEDLAVLGERYFHEESFAEVAVG